jgi:nitrate reductase gamma subunit
MLIMRYGVFVSFFLSLVLLTVQVVHTLSFGRRRLHSPAEGSRWKGVTYAFGRGMLPWEKESAARHLPTYIAGMIYHAGVFAAILSILFLAAGIRPPEAAVTVFRFFLAAGFLSGAGLLLKRGVQPRMRYISCPDDYVSNLIVDGFVLSGLLSSLLATAEPVFFILAILTFLYMPLGKIRHCFFFFYSRLLFGSYFGRRGVLPPRHPSKA